MDTEKVSSLLPPKPEEPLDSECCGTGCTPCVFDIYKENLKRWEEECDRIRSGINVKNIDDNASLNDTVISPYNYSDYIVKEIVPDCLSCKIIHFQRVSEEHAHFINIKTFPVKLGQHIVLKINDKSRQYTVLDVRKDGSFTVIFKIYEKGSLTPLIAKLDVNSLVQMRGPFGKEFLYKPNSYQNLITFAAGTGIAPFCRIFSTILENDKDETRVLLLYACRSEDEVLLLHKMKEWSRSWNFQVKYFLSKIKDHKKAQGLHYGMQVINGKVDKTVIENLREIKTENNLYLICGTKSFDKDVLNYLKSVGIKEEKIKLL